MDTILNDNCITFKNLKKKIFEGFRNAIRLLRKQGYKNTSNILYKGMRHEILNDRKKYRVYADILKFINS